MGGKGSGAPALTLEQLLERKTFRPHRHDHLLTLPPAIPPVTGGERRRVLANLSPDARRLASALLDSYGPWSAASLTTLRAYALSCERLEALQQQAGDAEHSRAVHREVRCGLALLKALELEK